MFQPGELVVYGSTGVCRVEEVAQPDVTGADRKRLYYRLKPLQQDGVIYTPVENNGKVPIRPVITETEAEELIDLIPNIRAEAYHGTTLQALAQHYQNAVRTHDCRDLLELLRSIYVKRQQAEAQNRRLGMVDERFMKQAERLLYGELSAALGIPEEEVEPYIAQRIERGRKAGSAGEKACE
jgi:CarD family transcriptional regulator